MLKFCSFFILLFTLTPALGVLKQSTKPSQVNVYLERNTAFSTFDAMDNVQGVVVDYWHRWSELTGIAVTFHHYNDQDISLLGVNDQAFVYSGLQMPSATTSLGEKSLFVINSRFYYRSQHAEQITSSLLNDKVTITVGGLLPLAQQQSIFSTMNHISYKEYKGLLELLSAVYTGEVDALVLFEGEHKRKSLLNRFLSLLFSEQVSANAKIEFFVYVSQEQKTLSEWIDWGKQLLSSTDEFSLSVEKTANPIWGVSSSIQIKILFFLMLIILFFAYNRAKRKKDLQFKTLLDDSPYPLAILSLNGRVIYYLNDEVQSLFPTKKINKEYFFSEPENQLLLSNFINKASHKVAIETEPIRLLVGNDFHDIELSAKRVYYQGKTAWLCYLKDVNALLRAEKKLTEERELLRKVLDSIPEQILFKSPKGTVIGCNDAWAKANATEVIKATGKHLLDIISPDWVDKQNEQELTIWHGEKSNTQEWIQQANGQLSLINTTKLPLYNNQSRIFGLLSIEKDMTDFYDLNQRLVNENSQRKKTEAALSKQSTLLSTVFAASLDPIGLLDQEGRVLGGNNAFAILMGYSNSDELIGKLQSEFLSAERNEWAERQNQQVIELEKSLTFEELIFLEGKKVWYEVCKTPFNNIESDFQGIVIMARDITLHKQTEHKLASEASDYEIKMLHDQLTGIANRRAFDANFEALWEEACQEQVLLSLVMCDVDFFKFYNDNYGHQKGDKALLSVAQALQKKCDELGCFVARYGGEEFVILIKGGNAVNALKVAEGLRGAVVDAKIEHLYSSVSKVVTMSMGLSSVLPSKLHTMAMLLAEADSAVYDAKENGRNQISVHSPVAVTSKEDLCINT